MTNLQACQNAGNAPCEEVSESLALFRLRKEHTCQGMSGVTQQQRQLPKNPF